MKFRHNFKLVHRKDVDQRNNEGVNGYVQVPVFQVRNQEVNEEAT